MKQVTSMLVTLLKEPKNLAVLPPPSQSGISRSEFNTYVATSAFDQEMLIQTIAGGGTPLVTLASLWSRSLSPGVTLI